uniref:Galactose oxidase n=1 Tax=Alexandrium catenella TaxID=2925 RepID=A0A7S1M776_ALECA
MTTPRSGLAAATAGGLAFALGGCDASGQELCSLECFDPQVGAWRLLGPMAVSRWGLGAVVSGHRLYALGGTEGIEGASIGACERYCLPHGDGQGSPHSSAAHWSFVGCLRLPRRLFGAAVSR